jgi:hypothetical protein
MLRIGRVYGPGFSSLHFPAVADGPPAADVQNNLRTCNAKFYCNSGSGAAPIQDRLARTGPDSFSLQAINLRPEKPASLSLHAQPVMHLTLKFES